jgi:hypothetical protein
MQQIALNNMLPIFFFLELSPETWRASKWWGARSQLMSKYTVGKQGRGMDMRARGTASGSQATLKIITPKGYYSRILGKTGLL